MAHQHTSNNGLAGPLYTYTPAGRLESRTWARGVTTTYTYDIAGELSGVAYSDSTPALSYGYDRLGRLATVRCTIGPWSSPMDSRGVE